MKGIVPDQILDRKDKIGYSASVPSHLLSTSSIMSSLLSYNDPKIDLLVTNYKSILLQNISKSPFINDINWRIINYLILYSTVLS